MAHARAHDGRAGEADGDHGSLGSGKSTLMQILAGLDRPTSGSVRLDGVEITDWVAG
jgi:putative ABC transport system ATP-binding protein